MTAATLPAAADETSPDTDTDAETYPCRRLAPDETLPLDFDGSLHDFTRLVACITGKRFLLADDVAGRVIVLSPDPMTRREVFQAYLGALELNGLTMVRRGRFHRVVPKPGARRAGAPIQWVTEFVAVQHAPIQDVRALVARFATEGADVSVYAPSSTLVITEREDNLRRLQSLIRRVDRPETEPGIYLHVIRHRDADEVAQAVRALSAADLTVAVEPRTNQLVVLTHQRGYERVHRLIERLDRARASRGDDIFVHHLRHTNVRDLEPVLNSLLQNERLRRGGQY